MKHWENERKGIKVKKLKIENVKNNNNNNKNAVEAPLLGVVVGNAALTTTAVSI